MLTYIEFNFSWETFTTPTKENKYGPENKEMVQCLK